MGEMFLIATVILVFVGPEHIPEMMAVAGRFYGKIRRMSDDLRRSFNAEVARVESDKRRGELDTRRKEADVRRQAEREAAEREVEDAERAPDMAIATEPAGGAEPSADPNADP